MKLLAASLVLATSSVAFASDQVEYSVAEYCDIKSTHTSSVVQQQLVKAYEKKLGFKPSHEQCIEERNIKFVGFTPYKKDWDFFQNKPYPGSVIRLSQNQVEKLRQIKQENGTLSGLFSSID